MMDKNDNKYQDDYEKYYEHENVNGKFEATFGAAWLAFVFLVTIIIFFNSEELNISLLMIVAVFWIVGYHMLKTGLKKMAADRDTEKYGTECYGKIYKIINAGSVNGNQHYTAKIVAYIPSEGISKMFQEDIGFDRYEFPENSYLRLRYYKDDVNIKGVVDSSYISENARKSMEQLIEDTEKEEIETQEMYNNPNYTSYSATSSNVSETGIAIGNSIAKFIGIVLVGSGLFHLLFSFVMLFIFFVTSNIPNEGDSSSSFLSVTSAIYTIVMGILYIAIGIKLLTQKINNKAKSESIDDKKKYNYDKINQTDETSYNSFENVNDDPIRKF